MLVEDRFEHLLPFVEVRSGARLLPRTGMDWTGLIDAEIKDLPTYKKKAYRTTSTVHTALRYS